MYIIIIIPTYLAVRLGLAVVSGGAARLPLEVDLHEPLLAARAVARPQHRLPHVRRLGLVQAHACVRVLYYSRLKQHVTG